MNIQDKVILSERRGKTFDQDTNFEEDTESITEDTEIITEDKVLQLIRQVRRRRCPS